jgi:hypothetical protein
LSLPEKKQATPAKPFQKLDSISSSSFYGNDKHKSPLFRDGKSIKAAIAEIEENQKLSILNSRKILTPKRIPRVKKFVENIENNQPMLNSISPESDIKEGIKKINPKPLKKDTLKENFMTPGRNAALISRRVTRSRMNPNAIFDSPQDFKVFQFKRSQ